VSFSRFSTQASRTPIAFSPWRVSARGATLSHSCLHAEPNYRTALRAQQPECESQIQ